MANWAVTIISLVVAILSIIILKVDNLPKESAIMFLIILIVSILVFFWSLYNNLKQRDTPQKKKDN